ncbi:MAG: ABC transporter permease [Pseudomonadota bacterium]
MTAALRRVFAKEVRDNFRDRRTVSSALLFGPLFGPVMFVAIMSLSLTRAVSDRDRSLELPVLGAGHAPALVAFLTQENVTVEAAPADRDAAIAAVRNGDEDVIVVVPDDYGEQLLSGTPVRIEVITDQSNAQAAGRAGRVRGLIDTFGRQIGALRLQARGIDPAVARALRAETIDTSTPTARSALLLGMLTYFMLFSMLMGGMYLAIDSTAGERERGSLEPLLTLPISRSELILGKIFAACFYMLLSLIVSLAAFVIALKFLPLQKLGMTVNFGPLVALQALAVLAPFSLLGASLMTVVASFTKSYKEAQSYVTVVMLLPTVPIIVAAVLTLRPSLELMLVPSLSQHLLVTELIKDQPLSLTAVLLSEVTTLLLGVVFAWIATRLYRREGLLV